jgi:hypothetical protein
MQTAGNGDNSLWRSVMVRKSIFILVSALFLLGLLAAQGRAQVERDRVYSDAVQKASMETVVRIKVQGANSSWQGSGVCVAYDQRTGVAIIVTAAHVVKGAKRMSFEVFTSASYPNPARRYAPRVRAWWNEKDDVAVIGARMWVPRTARLGKNPAAIRLGDHVFSVGCGIGAPPVAQVGEIGSFSTDGDYVIRRGAIGGRSGGPLFGRQGVVGIVSRGRAGETYFVSLGKIHRLLQRVGQSLQPAR